MLEKLLPFGLGFVTGALYASYRYEHNPNELFEMAGMNRPQKYVKEEADAKLQKLKGKYTIAVHPSCISKAMGHKKSNYLDLLENGIDIKIIGDESVPKYKCELRR